MQRSKPKPSSAMQCNVKQVSLGLGYNLKLLLTPPPRLRNQASWALPSYMGYAFESFSTTTGDDDAPGWSGDVNTNVQVGHRTVRVLTSVVQVSRRLKPGWLVCLEIIVEVLGLLTRPRPICTMKGS
jgi:hypothetical protein